MATRFGLEILSSMPQHLRVKLKLSVDSYFIYRQHNFTTLTVIYSNIVYNFSICLWTNLLIFTQSMRNVVILQALKANNSDDYFMKGVAANISLSNELIRLLNIQK